MWWHTPTQHNNKQIDAAIHSTHLTKIYHTPRRHTHHANTKGRSIDKHRETKNKRSQQKWQQGRTHITFHTKDQNRRGQNIRTLNTKTNPTNPRAVPNSNDNTPPPNSLLDASRTFPRTPIQNNEIKKGTRGGILNQTANHSRFLPKPIKNNFSTNQPLSNATRQTLMSTNLASTSSQTIYYRPN